MRTWTWRQYVIGLAWLRRSMEQPSLTDYYLMVVAREVRRVLHKKPNDVQHTDFLLKLEEEEKEEVTEEQKQLEIAKAAAFSKARWFSRMTRPVQDLREQSG